jgi:hypothetical protein
LVRKRLIFEGPEAGCGVGVARALRVFDRRVRVRAREELLVEDSMTKSLEYHDTMKA